MDCVWDTSKYHPKLSVGIFKVRVIQGQGKVKWKILGLGGVVHVFLVSFFFVKNAKNGPRTLFELPKPDKFGK